MNPFFLKKQFIPIFLTVVIFFLLILWLDIFIHILNIFPTKEKIIVLLRPADIIIGFTIYLKTSVDFAMFIGNLMQKYPGWKNRVAIEAGTALGNGLGILLVLTIWTFFKEIPWLLAIMIIVAAFVLFRMAEDGLKEFQMSNLKSQIFNTFIGNWIGKIAHYLKFINAPFSPIIEKIVPHLDRDASESLSRTSLFLFSFSAPFVLGLDDFAGYIPLFSLVNIFGFAAGIFLGHMLLNIFLFASPKYTTTIVKQPFILLGGSTAFILLALWGLYEAFRIFVP